MDQAMITKVFFRSRRITQGRLAGGRRLELTAVEADKYRENLSACQAMLEALHAVRKESLTDKVRKMVEEAIKLAEKED